MHFTLWLGLSIVCDTGHRSNICHPPNYSNHTLSVGESIFKPRGRAIITRNVDLVSAPNRDIAGEAVVEDRLFLELQGHTGLPSDNVRHFLNVGHVAHQRQIIKNHPKGKTSEKYFHCSADWFPFSAEMTVRRKKKKNKKLKLYRPGKLWYCNHGSDSIDCLILSCSFFFFFFQLTGLFFRIFLYFCLELWKRIWTITFSSNYYSSNFSVYVFRFLFFVFAVLVKNNEIIVMTISGCIACAVNNYVVLITVCLFFFQHILVPLIWRLSSFQYKWFFLSQSHNPIKNVKILLPVLPLVDINENLMTKIYSAEAKRKAE